MTVRGRSSQAILCAIVALAVMAVPAAAFVPFPTQSDWVDQGIFVEPGPNGAWDSRFYQSGFSPGGMVRKDGQLLMYYTAAAGDRSTDDGPAHRAIGVMTCNVSSVDCTNTSNWSKYSGNPVVTYNPNPNHSNTEEEGAWSVAAAIDPANGDVVLYYGGLYAVDSSSVDGEVRGTRSTDGFNFTDDQSLFVEGNHPSSIQWECSECAPTGAIVVDGTWYVFTATGEDWDLGLFWGPAWNDLPNSKQVTDEINGERISDGGKITDLDGDEFLLVVGHNPSSTRTYDWHRIPKSDPTSFPAWEMSHVSGSSQPPGNPWPSIKHQQQYFDAPTSMWYMFYQVDEPDHRPYGLMTFQGGPPDDTPPSTPQNLSADVQGVDSVELSWSASSDAESGISNYRVYRDGNLVGEPTGTTFTDDGLSESTTYSYTVSAVNGATLESSQSQSVDATTPADTVAPQIESVSTGLESTEVFVEFDEPVEQSSATNTSNYALNQGATISAASLGGDLRTVTLTTSQLTPGPYTLTVNNVRDRASSPNTIAPNTQVVFDYDDTSEIELRISSDNDDAESEGGDLETGSSDLELGEDQLVGLRFLPLDIPQGASIYEAWVQFTTDETESATASLTIEGEASDNAATFGAFANRPRTDASVAWSPAAWTTAGEAGPAQRTPDISEVIEEIVGRTGWQPGNALALVISGTGVRTAEAYDASSAEAALLHVVYSSGSQPPGEPPPAPSGLSVD